LKEPIDSKRLKLTATYQKVCAPLQTLEDGRLVHKQLIQTGCESDIFVGSSLVDMYAKCGSIEDAWRVFNKMPS
jgi:pentatricopeptide repeat protein